MPEASSDDRNTLPSPKAEGAYTSMNDATTSAAPSSAQVNTDLAMRRTGMSFQRTRMAADRTLMSVIRTSLSLIGFGFMIFELFKKLKDAGVFKGATAALNFGVSLVVLGTGMLILGIVYHVMFMLGLRHLRSTMKAEGLIRAESQFPASLVLIVAVVLLLIGGVAIISMVGHVGPFV
jgi:putative membrane protein